jgi:hypothetical protein
MRRPLLTQSCGLFASSNCDRHRTHFNVLSQIFPADLVQYAADRGLLAEVLEPEAPDAGAPSLGATQDYPPLAPPTSGSYL